MNENQKYAKIFKISLQTISLQIHASFIFGKHPSETIYLRIEIKILIFCEETLNRAEQKLRNLKCKQRICKQDWRFLDLMEFTLILFVYAHNLCVNSRRISPQLLVLIFHFLLWLFYFIFNFNFIYWKDLYFLKNNISWWTDLIHSETGLCWIIIWILGNMEAGIFCLKANYRL